MKRFFLFLLIITCFSLPACSTTPTEYVEPPIYVETVTSTNTAAMQSTEKPEPTKTSNPPALIFLEKIDIFTSLGISPDDITYDPTSNHLFISAANDERHGTPESNNSPFKTGIFELTLDGELVRQIPFEAIVDTNKSGFLGYSIARVSNGPTAGHFFLVGLSGEGKGYVNEFDKNWNWINTFIVNSTKQNTHPGDGIVHNPISGNLVIAEEVSGEIIEITTDGTFMRAFPNINVQGITYSEKTGTYFGVHTSKWLREISSDGKILREIDLEQYGVGQPVGITVVGDKLYITDELETNTGGYLFIFEITFGNQ